MTSLVQSLTALDTGAQADGGKPDQELSEQRLCPALRAASPLCRRSPDDHPSLYSEGQQGLSSSHLGGCLFSKQSTELHAKYEYSISTSLEKFSMDATNPRSFTPFQPVHHSLCFHKRRSITGDWRVYNRDSNTPDIQLNSY